MNKVAIIDADSLLYFEMGKDTLEEAIQGIDSRLIEILHQTDSDSIIGFLTKGKCFRYDVAKSKPYKHNRPGASKPPIFYALKAYIQQPPWNFKTFDGLEADDLVGLARTWHLEKGFATECTICSPDKDVLKQLPGKHYNYQKAEFHETSKEEAEAFLWKQVLMGDSTDGIPGIPGLGIKTADAIIDNMPDVLSYAQVVLNKYIEKFKLDEGIRRFAETFSLVRMHTDIDIASFDVPALNSIGEDFFETVPFKPVGVADEVNGFREEDEWE